MRYRCPVCLFSELLYPPVDYHICPCCGTEFGNDDQDFTHAQLRELWIADGAHWFFGQPPSVWNPWMQLIMGGHPEAVPTFTYGIEVGTNMVSRTSLRNILNQRFVLSVA